MDSGRQLVWRSAVVPVPAKGRVRVVHPAGSDAVGSGAVGSGAAGSSVARSSAAGVGVADSPDPRERAIAAMVRWCYEGDRPLWLVEGGAGSGKTRLATDVADRLVQDRWPCGWARPGFGAFAVTAAARNGRHALVLVDDADTRADMFDLLIAAANGGRPTGIRVIITARDFGAWWTTALARLSPAEQEILAAGRTVMGGGSVTAPSARALALREAGRGPQRRAATTLATADPVSPAILLRQAALVVALSTRVGQLGPAEVRAALRDLFEEEEGYWRRIAVEVAPPGQPAPALRSALACTAIVGIDGLSDAATVLRRVPAVAAGAADRLARLAVWWHGLYARAGEHAAPTPRLPTWLADRLPDGTDSTDSTGISWAVAALDAERLATSTLNRLAIDAHRDVWPSPGPSSNDPAAVGDSLRRAVTLAAPVDQALAWLTQELELDEEDLATLGEAISYPTRSLSRTAIVLARRLLEAADTEEHQAALALDLGARYSEVGRWEDARRLSERAVETFRSLTDRDRERHLPDLAGAVANLGSCLAQVGRNDEALDATYEAVALHRELLEISRDRYLPALARALTNLSACLSRSGRRPAALGAAGQAVAIYRELVGLHPSAYTAELAAADHNWRVCREVLNAGAPLPSGSGGESVLAHHPGPPT